ncbi:MAG: alginate export family protein [Acidobacteria bacterium]|nr:alginate export family protein [Acidobacteriota bacterium]
MTRRTRHSPWTGSATPSRGAFRSLLKASRFVLWLLLAAQPISSAFAQAPSPAPFKVGNLVFSGSLRTRVESWDWFEGNANSDYAFLGSILRLSLGESTKTRDWQFELALPVLAGLPSDAIAPGAQGQLGFGASYFAANNRNTTAAMLFPRQGFVRFKGLGGIAGQSLKVGRMEVIDGTEVIPQNATLAALKRDRVAHRILGNFGFSHVGRSFDGAQYVMAASKLNLTLFGGRPTRGVFQVDGWGEANVNVFYGALTGQLSRPTAASEWRLFGLGYNDYRDRLVKTDNRPPAVRSADTGQVNIGSFGGHYLQSAETAGGAVDFLLWGVIQTGSWGALRHRAGAVAAEAGWQPKVLPTWKPWLRVGYNHGSGDGDPNDGRHKTFFPNLPTPRIYARFPLSNMMNNRDLFGELILRHARRLTIRSDIHSLWLANKNDLWYSGGGVFQPWTFGYAGRSSGGQSGLATLYDVSADFDVKAHFAVNGYFGHAASQWVGRFVYPKGGGANFGYLELTIRF